MTNEIKKLYSRMTGGLIMLLAVLFCLILIISVMTKDRIRENEVECINGFHYMTVIKNGKEFLIMKNDMNGNPERCTK